MAEGRIVSPPFAQDAKDGPPATRHPRLLQRVGFPDSEPVGILKLPFVLQGEAPPRRVEICRRASGDTTVTIISIF